MGATSTGNERVRAWVLLQAESAEVVARTLYERLGHEGGNEYVVVRADVVAEPGEFGHNIIVPVDAKNELALTAAVNRILEESGASQAVIVRLGQHFPNPPHDAHGYITTEEVEAGRERIEKPGRQGASPGHNAWG